MAVVANEIERRHAVVVASKETLLLAAKAHELLVLAVGPLLWSRCSRSPRAMLTYDPWVLGFVFLLGVIVGHYFSTFCPY